MAIASQKHPDDSVYKMSAGGYNASFSVIRISEDSILSGNEYSGIFSVTIGSLRPSGRGEQNVRCRSRRSPSLFDQGIIVKIDAEGSEIPIVHGMQNHSG